MTEKCGAIGALTVGGRVVGSIKCELSRGHRHECERCRWEDGFGAREPIGHEHPDMHAVTLTWTPETEPDLDLFDPAEHFDVDVPVGIEMRDAGLCECGEPVEQVRAHDGVWRWAHVRRHVIRDHVARPVG